MGSGEKPTKPLAQTSFCVRQRWECCACAMDQHLPQVAMAALADAHQPVLSPCAHLTRLEPEPSGEVPPTPERFAGSDCCDQGSCIQHADAGDGGQTTR